MWAPVDITALPDARDLIDAKIAIETVENGLEDAYLALARMQLRIAALEKDLQERRAWIAPVRRLSFDVLSHIFEICGEDSWKMPLRISGVSRHWRNTVLATPRAWAFLPVHKCEDNEDLTCYFLSHSGKRPLHVFLTNSQDLTLVSNVIGQLECLSVYDYFQIEEYPLFSKLKRLSIRSPGKIGLSYLQIAHFPALRELICESTIHNDTQIIPSSTKLTFPPLQVLAIAIEGDTAYPDLLKGCQSSLISLRLDLYNDYLSSRQELLLPVLKCMEIRNWHTYPANFQERLSTPAIETYIEFIDLEDSPVPCPPVHRDVGRVTRIRISQAIDLAHVPLLTVIQLGEYVDVCEILSQLQDGRSLCPSLEIIEIEEENDSASYENTLVEVNRGRSQQISIRRVETWVTTFPHAIGPFPCGPKMPCSGTD